LTFKVINNTFVNLFHGRTVASQQLAGGSGMM